MELIQYWASWLSNALGLPSGLAGLIVILAAILLVDGLQRLLMRHLGRVAGATRNPWDDAVHGSAVRPLSYLIWFIGLTYVAQWLAAAGNTGLAGIPIVELRQIGIVLALAWFLWRLVRRVESNVVQMNQERANSAGATTMHALSRVVRIIIASGVTLVVLDSLGVEIGGLLAAGGIGGLALGFAAKDLLANLFGGLSIFMNRPFSVGDWIKSPDRELEGVVERIGWRQTTIRRFDRRPIYVPNSIFNNVIVENPSRMTHRRIHEVIGIRYDDADKMPAIVDDVKAMLSAHDGVDQNQTLLVYFNAFNRSSLDFFIYCYTKTTDWAHYHEVKQDVLMTINHIVAAHGAEFAFPTSTVKVADSASPIDPHAAGAAADGDRA